jgi:hypothetical protein
LLLSKVVLKRGGMGIIKTGQRTTGKRPKEKLENFREE